MKKLTMEELGRPTRHEFQGTDKLPLVLVLDNVRSALNVGSVFRTSDAFALRKILLCGITATPPHREILKTALGSTETVEWEYFAQTTDALYALKAAQYRIYALEQVSPKIWLQDFEPSAGSAYALVLGNEVDGVSAEVLSLCDGALEIPQFGTKHSLNIAVAAGIAVWELALKMMPMSEVND